MKSINKNLRFRNGSILTYVLIIFLVLFILLTSILYVNSANIKQVIAQEDYLKAYYLAYAGVELGYAALMADDEALYEVFKNNANYQKTDSITYGENNEDKIDIVITTSSDKKTIKITSTGTYNKNIKSHTLSMSFPVGFPYLKQWE